MPESVKNRPTTATEEIFLFSKSPKYLYNSKAVTEDSGANLRNYWILGPEPSAKGHPAPFPKELVRRCVLLTSNPGDTILDPFGGSGTTGLVASEHMRKSVLIELNPQYVDMSRERTSVLHQNFDFTTSSNGTTKKYGENKGFKTVNP